RRDDLKTSRIPLTTAAAIELSVDAPGFVPFCCQHMKPSGLCDLLQQFDIGATARHVCRDRDPASQTGLRDDIRLFLVLTCVEDDVRDPGCRELLAQKLRGGDRPGSHQNRPPLFMERRNMLDDRLPLLIRRREEPLSHTFPLTRAV